MLKNRTAMARNMKGFALFTRAIKDDVSLLTSDKYWYVLSSSICRGRPGQLLKKNSVVSSFPDEFRTGEVHFGQPIETVVRVRPTLKKCFEIAAAPFQLCSPFC